MPRYDSHDQFQIPRRVSWLVHKSLNTCTYTTAMLMSILLYECWYPSSYTIVMGWFLHPNTTVMIGIRILICQARSVPFYCRTIMIGGRAFTRQSYLCPSYCSSPDTTVMICVRVPIRMWRLVLESVLIRQYIPEFDTHVWCTSPETTVIIGNRE
jgi:hypothetical protein